MEKGKEHIDYLIARHLSGEASQEEMLQLEKWMNESEENKKYFDGIHFLNDKAVASHDIIRVNTDKAWASIKQQMQPASPKKNKKQTTRTIQMPYWARIAAMVVVILSIALALYRNYMPHPGQSTETFSFASSDSTLNLQLTDSTQVIVNSNSKIAYSSEYGKKQRSVTLEGEAYFNVVHDEEKPFIVTAQETIIEDKGTAFNINAVPGMPTIEVFVENGTVLFYTPTNHGITLNAGETGVYDRATQTFQKHTQKNNIITYNDRLLIFQNAQLPEVIAQLNDIYHTNITIGDVAISNCKITVLFNNESIDVILEIISETLDLQLEKIPNGYILNGEGCSNMN